MTSPRIEAQNLCKTYHRETQTIKAIQDISLQAHAGETIAIMGPSGSGKTTLLNLLGALDKPSSGEILLEGQPTTELDDEALAALRLHRIGFIFQFYNLLPVLSVAENVDLPMLIANIPTEQRVKRVHELLELVGLDEKAHRRPTELSGGEQQRVAIARALANAPGIILADEPTGDLDEKTGLAVTQQLIDVTNQFQVCTIVVTHDPVIGDLMDRRLFLRDGRLSSKPPRKTPAL